MSKKNMEMMKMRANSQMLPKKEVMITLPESLISRMVTTTELLMKMLF